MKLSPNRAKPAPTSTRTQGSSGWVRLSTAWSTTRRSTSGTPAWTAIPASEAPNASSTDPRYRQQDAASRRSHPARGVAAAGFAEDVIVIHANRPGYLLHFRALTQRAGRYPDRATA